MVLNVNSFLKKIIIYYFLDRARAKEKADTTCPRGWLCSVHPMPWVRFALTVHHTVPHRYLWSTISYTDSRTPSALTALSLDFEGLTTQLVRITAVLPAESDPVHSVGLKGFPSLIVWIKYNTDRLICQYFFQRKNNIFCGRPGKKGLLFIPLFNHDFSIWPMQKRRNPT